MVFSPLKYGQWCPAAPIRLYSAVLSSTVCLTLLQRVCTDAMADFEPGGWKQFAGVFLCSCRNSCVICQSYSELVDRLECKSCQTYEPGPHIRRVRNKLSVGSLLSKSCLLLPQAHNQARESSSTSSITVMSRRPLRGSFSTAYLIASVARAKRR